MNSEKSQDKNAKAEKPIEFYAKRKKIYARKAKGTFATLRIWAMLILLGIYYIFPWINYRGHQAILLDLPARQFHIFGVTFWPQDFFYLAVILIIAAYLLFFVTALAGRLWCGYACPQTVWTEAFMWIERWIEGDRPQQMKLDKSPWTRDKWIKKISKHTLWILLALWTGYTFAGYFTPIRQLGIDLLNFNASGWATFWVFFYALATWGLGAMMREQVCIYMCPYARFQSAMFDKDTLVISYDEKRGEPRGKRKKGVDPKELGLGDCVDCTLCVQVCPTGIDIRDGLQYQCIACAACIDVCDEVMEKVGYPKGLIRYTTEHELQGGKTKILRLRTYIYAAVLVALVGGLAYSVSQRIPLELDVMRDRNTLYRENGEGMLENVYILKVVNMDTHPHEFKVDVRGLEGIELLEGDKTFPVAVGEVLTKVVKVQVDPAKVPAASNDIMFHIQSVIDPELEDEQKSRFLGPQKR
jgi:cytochrome c oxidase accessory protein FixG